MNIFWPLKEVFLDIMGRQGTGANNFNYSIFIHSIAPYC